MSKQITNEDLFNLIKSENQVLKTEIANVKNEIKSELDILKIKNEYLEKENQELKRQILFLERRQKKYNVIVYGIEGDEQLTDNKTLAVLNEVLNIPCNNKDLRDIRRIGKKVAGKPRPVQIEVINYNLKKEILNKSKEKQAELKENNIFFTSDYASEDYKERKLLSQFLKAAKEKKYKAKIENNKLVVDGKEYTCNQLKSNTSKILNNKANIETEEVYESLQKNLHENIEQILRNTYEEDEENKKRKFKLTPTKPIGAAPKRNTRAEAKKVQGDLGEKTTI